MEDLRKLESQLSSMQLKDVDKDLLEKLLGGDPKQDFEGVMRMQSLLEEGGYVLEQGERFELTPKGVRRVGHLALRDIYRQLRRGRFVEPRGLFDVRYWTPRELEAAFAEAVGPARLFVDGFFALNAQPSDLDLLPPRSRAVVRASTLLRRASERAPALRTLADSLYVDSTRAA